MQSLPWAAAITVCMRGLQRLHEPQQRLQCCGAGDLSPAAAALLLVPQENWQNFFHFCATQMGSELSKVHGPCSITSWILISGGVMASSFTLKFNKPISLCKTCNMFLPRPAFLFPSRLPEGCTTCAVPPTACQN